MNAFIIEIMRKDIEKGKEFVKKQKKTQVSKSTSMDGKIRAFGRCFVVKESSKSIKN